MPSPALIQLQEPYSTEINFSGFLESLQQNPHMTQSMDANHVPVSPQESLSPSTTASDTHDDGLTEEYSPYAAETRDFLDNLDRGNEFTDRLRGRSK